MQKIAINRCHGGFRLSDAAIHAIAEKKGITLFPEKSDLGFMTWWTVPEKERPAPQDDWYQWTTEQRKQSNAEHEAAQFEPDELPRNDSELVSVIEEMGEKSNGGHSGLIVASLAVVEIPDDVEWQIEEYDGLEWVAEKHRTWS